MTIKTERYARKPFLIDAVRVTADNMAEVAEWCKGEVLEELRGSTVVQYVKVDVSRPLNERQKKAYAGDWVLFAGRGWKCYSAKAFDDCFERPVQVSGGTREELAVLHSIPKECVGAGE